jgi:hypothetical protein
MTERGYIAMKYFVTNKERQGTCYHEFYKGKWDEKTFWSVFGKMKVSQKVSKKLAPQMA